MDRTQKTSWERDREELKKWLSGTDKWKWTPKGRDKLKFIAHYSVVESSYKVGVFWSENNKYTEILGSSNQQFKLTPA